MNHRDTRGTRRGLHSDKQNMSLIYEKLQTWICDSETTSELDDRFMDQTASAKHVSNPLPHFVAHPLSKRNSLRVLLESSKNSKPGKPQVNDTYQSFSEVKPMQKKKKQTAWKHNGCYETLIIKNMNIGNNQTEVADCWENITVHDRGNL